MNIANDTSMNTSALTKLAATYRALATFAAELWSTSDGDPAGKADCRSFAIAANRVTDLLHALPPVLREYPELIGSGSGFLVSKRDGWLWMTSDGRVFSHRGAALEEVTLSHVDPESDHTGYGSVDRARDAWPSIPLTRELILDFKGPLAMLVRTADRAAAEKVAKTAALISDSEAYSEFAAAEASR